MFSKFEERFKEIFASNDSSDIVSRKRKFENDSDQPPLKRRKPDNFQDRRGGLTSWLREKLSGISKYFLPDSEPQMAHPARPVTPAPEECAPAVMRPAVVPTTVRTTFDRPTFQPPLPKPGSFRLARHNMAAKQCIRLEERSQYAALLDSFVTHRNRTPFRQQVQPSYNGTPARAMRMATGQKRTPVMNTVDPELEIVKVDVPPRVRSPAEIRLRASLATSPAVDSEWSRSLQERFKSSVRLREREASEAQQTLNYLQEKRRNMEDELEERIRTRMTLSERIPPAVEDLPVEEYSSEEEEEEYVLVPLSDEDEEKVLMTLNQGRDDDVLVQGFKHAGSVTRRDLRTLRGMTWLNDEVINSYMSLLIDRSDTSEGKLPAVYAFSTFFYLKLQKEGHPGVRRWTKRANVDIFSKDLVIVPIHMGMHWCLAVMDITNKAIFYYDSMGGENSRCLMTLLQYLQAESKDKKNQDIDTSQWTLDHAEDIPQQMNGSDCGVFACQFAQCASLRRQMSFTQQDMPYFRHRMVLEILNKRLL